MVVKSDGTVRGYKGSRKNRKKIKLLVEEGREASEGIINLEKYSI
ncbi:MAG TPA: hypothetical protein VJC39_04870 [Candidatus Nanoarchaeia archaeon]|nr:hypothetical protein [Candidatus Nanoarchaeia archaeon]